MTRRWPFLAASFLAGFGALAFETVWIREVGLVAGRTAVSASLVLAVFFAAAGLGAWLGGGRAGRARRPLRMAGCALLGAAACGLAGFVALRFGKAWVALPAWGWALAVAGPASALLGSVFPCLGEAFAGAAGERTSRAGAFYAADLAGGASGVAVGGVLLPMALGYAVAFGVAAALLALAGGVALAADRGARERAVPSAPRANGSERRPSAAPPAWWGVCALAASGFLSLGAETLAVQWLLLLTDDCIYAVAAVLCAFLADLAAGAALATHLRRRGVAQAPLLVAALLASGLAASASPFVWRHAIGAGAWAADGRPLWATARLMAQATAALAPLVVCIGAVFPLAWESVERQAGGQGRALGRAIAVNKLACAVGAAVVPLVLVRFVGVSRACVVVGGLYGATALLAVWTVAAWRRRWAAVGTVAWGVAVAAGGALAPLPVRLAPGERLEGLTYDPAGVVTVVRDAEDSLHVVLNQTYTLNGTGRAMLSQQHESWLPIALAPKRGRVLSIGMASGISAAAALDFPVGELVAAEVVPGTVRMARERFGEWNAALFRDSRAQVVVGDGRHALRASAEPWDVVVCDLMLPWAEGAACLYSREFFREVRARLGERGVFCLWLPMYQTNAEVAGIVARTFRDEFPCALAVRGNFDPVAPIVGLIGSVAPFDLSDAALAARLAELPTGGLAARLSPFLRSPAHLRLALVGDLHASRALERWPANTDDRPIVAFRAPGVARAPSTLRGVKLLEWCDAHVPAREFPSCRTDALAGNGETSGPGAFGAVALRDAAVAGANYFASAVMRVPLPNGEKQAEREARAEFHLDRARQLSPAAVLRPDDLGR